MIQSLCILGRQPAIGRAELESIYGKDLLEVIGDKVVGLGIPADQVDFERLGGSIRLCNVIGEISATNWNSIERQLIANIGTLLPNLSSGKLKFGISVYDIDVNNRQVQATGLKLKQVIKSTGQSVRMVPNQFPELSSAQVLNNHLTGEKGVELVLARYENRVVVARTTAVQDINSYTERDRGRPKRDARVGMLPPKLAQTLINLAKPTTGDVLLDPFCGTGVVLQEAALMNLEVYGTDLEPRMIEYTDINLEWLRDGSGKPKEWKTEVGDATDFKWQKFDLVASEVYLGQPFSAFPEREKLNSVINTCNKITEAFLNNVHAQMQPGTRLALAVPAWQDPKTGRFHHLPLLDQIEVLGYNRVSFYHASHQEMIYYRPGQVVGRELMVITRK